MMVSLAPHTGRARDDAPAASPRAPYRAAAAVLLLEVLLILGPTAALGAVFRFPGILDEPAAVVLPLFQAHRGTVMGFYYLFTLSGVAFIPLALLVQRALTPRPDAFMRVATAFGVATGVTQSLGFIRWDFVVPYLASAYTDPRASAATRGTVSVVYEAFNAYAGHAVGEHLGFLCNIVWGVMVGLALARSPRVRPWIGWAGVVAALGVLSELLIPFAPGLAPALEQVFIVSYSFWVLWLALVAVAFWRARPDTTAPTAPTTARVTTV